MEKSQQMEKIQLEFDTYEGPTPDLMDVLFLISNSAEEVDVERGIVNLARKTNKRRKFISECLGKYAKKFGYLTVQHYEEDSLYFNRLTALLNNYYSQLNKCWEAVDEDNYGDIYKLMFFARSKAFRYKECLWHEKESFEKTGILNMSQSVALGQEMAVFSEWFDNALDKIENVPNIEKTKK